MRIFGNSRDRNLSPQLAAAAPGELAAVAAAGRQAQGEVRRTGGVFGESDLGAALGHIEDGAIQPLSFGTEDVAGLQQARALAAPTFVDHDSTSPSTLSEDRIGGVD
jgi:hypothetical protein